MVEPAKHCYIRYDGGVISDKVFVDDLQAALGLVIDTDQDDLTDKLKIASGVELEWIELIFVFASAAIINGY